MNNAENFYGKLPKIPGVYLMKNAIGKILYIGKAADLKRRVSSYFLRPQDFRIEKLLSEVEKIGYKKTDTALEALILEAKLIKKFEPPFNIREKDDKSFLYVEITKEKFPRVLLARGKSEINGERFGPFVSASSIRESLKILRRIFSWSMHSPDKSGKKPCFDYQIGLCPGTCIGAISQKDYFKNIRNLKLIFQGKKKDILKNLNKEMKIASDKLEFEKAEKLKRQIFALRHIQDVALINDSEIRDSDSAVKHYRIEGYDISNISGTSAVGSMVVFIDGKPAKSEYRKFKIRTIQKPNDVGMLKEILRRRFQNNWPLPDLILIDGGRGQVNAAKQVLATSSGVKIPIVGIAKGNKRKDNKLIGEKPPVVDKKTLIKARDEAHRFAIKYHKSLRGDNFIKF